MEEVQTAICSCGVERSIAICSDLGRFRACPRGLLRAPVSTGFGGSSCRIFRRERVGQTGANQGGIFRVFRGPRARVSEVFRAARRPRKRRISGFSVYPTRGRARGHGGVWKSSRSPGPSLGGSRCEGGEGLRSANPTRRRLHKTPCFRVRAWGVAGVR